jgi:hypothetical protein
MVRHIFRPPSAAGAGALVAEDADRDEVLFAIKIVLRTRFQLGHADVPLEGRRFRDLLAAGIPSIRLTKKAVQP